MAASPEKVQVDSHAFLLGRGRPPPEQVDKLLGRQHGDSEKLFPRFTHAAAAASGEVTVNGQVVKIWTSQQLEALSRSVLRDRALAVRNAVGEGNCPPIPSGQQEDLARWILDAQAKLTGQEQASARGGSGRQEQPATSPESRPLPFGPRASPGHNASRDHYSDLKHQRNDFKEPPNLGIQSGRPGGEGRRHLPTGHSMVGCGVSDVEARGIQTLRAGGEGRRYLAAEDHVADLKRQEQAPGPPFGRGGSPARSSSPRSRKEPVKHVSETHMCSPGVAAPEVEPPIGGERRRHRQQQDRMLNHGTSAPHQDVDARAATGRRHLDSFGGPRTLFSDEHDTYQSTWKKDPSRLLGTSLIV